MQNGDFLKIERKGKMSYFTVLGDVDHHSAKKIKQLIDSEIFIAHPDTVCMDLSRVEFMDSSGLGLILGRYQIATELGIDFKIISPTERVMKILRLAGCEKILDIVKKDKAN